jgi:hypothetical protein
MGAPHALDRYFNADKRCPNCKHAPDAHKKEFKCPACRLKNKIEQTKCSRCGLCFYTMVRAVGLWTPLTPDGVPGRQPVVPLAVTPNGLIERARGPRLMGPKTRTFLSLIVALSLMWALHFAVSGAHHVDASPRIWLMLPVFFALYWWLFGKVRRYNGVLWHFIEILAETSLIVFILVVIAVEH